MCEPTTIMLVATAVGGALTAGAQYQQGQVAKQVGRNNQIMAEYAAQDAQRKGEEDAIAVQRRANAIKGSQRAKMAASGLDLEIGTAGELQDQVDFFSQGDKDMTRFNAARDAWSMRARGSQAAAEGAAGARTGNLQAFGTALSTAGSVAGKWYGAGGGGGGQKDFVTMSDGGRFDSAMTRR
jgi:hypothetical protein